MKKVLGASSDNDMETLRAENEELRSRVADVEDKIERLTVEVTKTKLKNSWSKKRQKRQHEIEAEKCIYLNRLITQN